MRVTSLYLARIFYFLLLLTLFLSSCGAKKKTVLSNPRDKNYGNVYANEEKHKGNVVSYYADYLGVKEKDLNTKLYVFIDQWMGSPHQLGGTTRSGIDCSAFVGMAYNTVYGKDLPRTSRDMAEVVKRKYDHQLKEGDLVFFSFGGKAIDHVGIYLQNDMFVHVSTKKGVMISNLKETWFYKYFTRCGTPIL
ncbi:C40 family peptidase [Sphingobacterium sp. Mn56C]|uniref:C40 family peptidase n=1 Tax=Sphingobacterium sp. Mn56C TaxID=3395261 RepID=UPI003BEEAC73